MISRKLAFRLPILLLLTVISLSGLTQVQQSKLAFVYWMPYDNNLSHWADTIYSQIQSGLSSEDVLITIQKDVADKSGMTRSIISNSKTTHEQISDEKSYSGKSYDDYLNWVTERVKSDKFVLIFLDHGGKLDEVGLDEYPKREFLRIDSISWAINRFNSRVDKKTELVYLQVCTKGSIEPIYELKDVSEYTMFSQTILGAPNFYYDGFYKEISASDKNLSGEEIAKLITKHERKDMYSSLMCVNNSKFDSFTKEFNKFIAATDKSQNYRIDKNKLLFYSGQTYFDLGDFCSAFTDIDTRNIHKSIKDLLVMKELSSPENEMASYSGISLLAIQKNYAEFVQKYQHLKFFQDFDMQRLHDNITKILENQRVNE